MPKGKKTNTTKFISTGAIADRQSIVNYYRSYFYNLFMNKYDIESSIKVSRSAKDFFFRKMWTSGKIAIFKHKHVEELGFADFAPVDYDMYWWPSVVNLINERGVSDRLIPSAKQNVDSDVVIGYANRMKRSVSDLVFELIDYVVDAEILIKICTATLAMPFIIATESHEQESKLLKILERILEGEPAVFMSVDDINSIKTLVNSNPYILDKVYEYRNQRLNEIKTYLGIDNSGETDTSDRGLADAVNANNQEINENSQIFIDCINEMSDTLKEVFSVDFKIVAKYKMVTSLHEEDETEEGDEENEE